MEDASSKSGKASSVSSKNTSSRSSTSNAAARARALAETAQSRASFAEREKKEKARLEAEKATLEAKLEALQAEKEAAAVQAEAEILEAAAEFVCCEARIQNDPSFKLSTSNTTTPRAQWAPASEPPSCHPASFVHSSQTPNSHSNECKGWHLCKKARTPVELLSAKHVILKSVQKETYKDEISALVEEKNISRSSVPKKLSPQIHNDLLKIGGRLGNAYLDQHEKNPIIIPKNNHVTTLLLKYYHQEVKQEGHQFTEEAIRTVGLWIVNGKRLISSILYNCVTCRKLRGRFAQQRMADLPPERLDMSPPFSYVGLDVFSLWTAVTRRTRGGATNCKLEQSFLRA
ncbi:hypothetical protein QQF64_033740 [Cirrhinus molitorella]|uniref:Integrase zinc-binding domain-containing protein n=1 Tax=Cirrhinus molitorella TaxID=172907 RepID=A0ABR3MUR4_9TELE